MIKVHSRISASIICGNWLELEKEIRCLDKNSVDALHFDVMDGIFVSRYGLFPELLASIRPLTKLPIELHFMTVNPENYLDSFAEAGANVMSIHVENSLHLHRSLKMIRSLGKEAGVVLNIATPLSVLDYIKDDITYVTLMGINPGVVGHKIIPVIYKKIRDLKKIVKNYPIQIIIDGGVTLESAPKMVEMGADLLVCGSSTIYKEGKQLDEEIGKFKDLWKGRK